MTQIITTEAGRLVLAQNVVDRKLKRIALAVPAIAALLGIIGAVTDLRIALFSVALILGWTQLVGL